MSKDIKINFDIKSVYGLFAKHGLTLFIIIVVGGLSAAVLILTSTIEKTSHAGSVDSTDNINSFDQATIDRVNQLSSSDSSKSVYVPPGGRINPFSE